MRFRFCWDVDCPDWLLAEMATLSKMTSVKLRLLCSNVAKSLISIPPEPINYESIIKLTNDAKIDNAGAKAVVAAVHWILESAAGSDTGFQVLDSELQQLGLPKEHATALTKVYSEYQDRIRSGLVQKSLKVADGTTWDSEVKGVRVGDKLEPIAILKVNHPNEPYKPTKEICLTSDQLDVLIQELSDARQMVDELH